MRPTGKVTFLFTDIEDSTRLAQELVEVYPEILNRHNSILRKAIESNNGFVFKIIGDAHCCSFQNAEDAVKAACDIQRQISEDEKCKNVVKVRIGIHSGMAEWNGFDYMGYLTLSRVSRVLYAANGEQTLISNASYELAQTNLKINPEISFRDLGERRLKDIAQPVRLYQINVPGLRADFPPLKTLDARPNNLQIQLTSFIGREEEISDIKNALVDKRFLTLIGFGGAGKTRLALQVGADIIDDFADGVWLVELAPLSDHDLITFTISKALGVGEMPGQDTETTLMNYLKNKELLIILDNCEHLVNECARISEKILKNSARVKIIATSREALRSSGETVLRIDQLSMPDPSKENTPIELSQFEAVRLFIERGLAVNSEFRVNNENAPALAQICYHLDGIPLAIELAAARVNIMSVEKICEKLSDRFRLLTAGKRTALPRQQTLRAMIDWSYDTFTEKEKILFQRLSVFTGGWTLEAAEEVCSDDDIDIYEMLDTHTSLLDKSFINAKEISGSIRFHLLETVKKYSNEKLGEDNNLSKRHFDYYSKICNPSQMRLKGIDQLEFVNVIDAELDNMRTAIKWALENEQEDACSLIHELSEFWMMKGYMLEGIQTVLKILNSDKLTDEYLRAKMKYDAAALYQSIGNSADAEKCAEESLVVFREKNSSVEIAECLNVLAIITYTARANYAEALEMHEEALIIFREHDVKHQIAKTLYLMSFPLHLKGDSEAALKYKIEANEIYKALGDMHMVCLVNAGLGVYELRSKNYESAKVYTEESLAVAERFGNKYLISINLINLGGVYKALKEYEKAEHLIRDAILITEEWGYISSLLVAQMNLGDVTANGFGDYKKAIGYFKQSIRTGHDAGINFFLSTNIFWLGISYFKLNDYENSLKYFSFVEKIVEDKNDPLGTFHLKEADECRKEILEILGNEKYDVIKSAVLKLSKEDFVQIVMSNE